MDKFIGNYVIAVHIGAGYHSLTKEARYKALCKEACTKATKELVKGCSAIDAVTIAIQRLEDSELTNAGCGSNLTEDGCVECDASIMEAEDGHFGAVGALFDIKNPICVAKQLLLNQINCSLKLGRTPPCFIVGAGAKQWAITHGLEQAGPSAMTSQPAYSEYIKVKRRLNDINTNHEKKCPRTSSKLLDTIGAVCIDAHGKIACGASSGGILMKHPGRVGQAAVYGCGCWAEKSQSSSVAAVTTGGGELLIKSMLCKDVCEKVLHNDDIVGSLVSAFNDKILVHGNQSLAGILLLKLGHENTVELQWAHTTESMCIGYATSNLKSPVSVITRLEPSSVAKQVNIQGSLFNFKNCKKPP